MGRRGTANYQADLSSTPACGDMMTVSDPPMSYRITGVVITAQLRFQTGRRRNALSRPMACSSTLPKTLRHQVPLRCHGRVDDFLRSRNRPRETWVWLTTQYKSNRSRAEIPAIRGKIQGIHRNNGPRADFLAKLIINFKILQENSLRF